MRFNKLPPHLALLLLLPSLALGYGTRDATQDAEATARGNAFAATADDPAAIYYNPAGLMQLDGFNVEAGFYGISIDEQYKPLHGQEGGHDSTGHDPFQAAPQLFLSYHPKDQVYSFGIGVYSPFGLKTEWPDDASFRQAGVYGSLVMLAFNPTFAVQITRSLSLGLGISANYMDADLREGLTAMPGDSFSFKGNGLAVGGDAGIMWKPTQQHSIGFTYHSPISGDLTGHTQTGLNGSERGAAEAANAKIAAGKQQLQEGIQQINSLPIPASDKAALIANAQAEYNAQLTAYGVPASGSFPTSYPTLGAKGTLRFPQYAVLGYSFRPTPDWNLEADVDWTDWDSVNNFALKRSDGSTVNVPFDWTHSFLYELGATHTIGAYKLSAGYIYSENSVPSATFNPIIPDGARHIVSVGVGRTFGNCSVNLAYELSIGVNRTIVNDSAADGRYSFLSNAVSISLGYHF
jgi:long-chain fatty acid transport protein